MEDVVFWLVFIVFFASIAVPICLLLYFGHRAGVETQLTVRKAIEQGQQLSPEILEQLSQGASSPERDRRRGVIGIAIGIGLAILGFLAARNGQVTHSTRAAEDPGQVQTGNNEMNDREHSREDELERLFQTLNSPLSDRDFVRDVMRRTTRYARFRRLTLGAAAAIGVAISAVPFIQLVNGLAERLVFAGTHWAESASPIQAQILAAVILCSVVLPSVLRWMSR